jgi:type I restriction enzyme S subunit
VKAWNIVPMGKLCSIQSGKSDTKDAVPDGPYAFFDRSKTVKRSNRFLRDCEALILPGEGTEFLPRHHIGKFDLHQRAYALFDFRPEISVKFLYYYLHHSADYFPRVAVGATVKSLRLRHFEDLPVSITDIETQHRIVTLLDEAFADIATAKANAEKNLQNARELFESHLQATFTIQEGWTLKSFGELAEFRNGINFTKSSKGEAIKIVGVRDFQKNFWAPLDDLETIIPEGEMPASDLIQSGDILFVRSNGNPELIGRSLLVGDLQEPITHSGFTIKARLRVTQLSPIYLCHYLKSGLLRREMIEGGNGANIKSLNQGTLSRLKIAFPDKAKQLMLVEQLEKVQAEIAELESIYRQKLTALDDLKKSLLHQAFSGQL